MSVGPIPFLSVSHTTFVESEKRPGAPTKVSESAKGSVPSRDQTDPTLLPLNSSRDYLSFRFIFVLVGSKQLRN